MWYFRKERLTFGSSPFEQVARAEDYEDATKQAGIVLSMQVSLQVISFFLLKHVQCVDISPASYCFASVVITERNGKKLYGQKAIHWLPLYMAVFLQRHKVACLKRYISCFFTRTSCELNCMSKGFSCNFLDLAVRQSPQGLSCDIFDKCSQPEYAGIEMIRMPHVHSSMSITVKLGVINSQFYSLSRLCFCMRFFVFEMLSLIVLLKIKCYPLKFLLKRTRALLNKENFLLGTSAFGFFRMILFRV
jgi:hypothetical protein